MEEYKVVLSGLLVVAILWMFFVPSKQLRTQMQKDYELKQKRKNRISERATHEALGITGIMAHRGESTTFLTNIKPYVVLFAGIAKGFFSDTVFIVVNDTGEVKQYATEVLAQNAFKKGDYGITALTMSDGIVTTRNVVPDTVHETNSFRLQYNFVLNPK